MSTQNFYKGFSTRRFLDLGTFSVTDVDCVKEDLLNHIYTDFGERIHMPNFGTNIPTIVFEPDDLQTIDVIQTDLRNVFDYDPRVQLLDLQVYSLPDNNAIVAIAQLLFLEFNVVDDLKIQLVSN